MFFTQRSLTTLKAQGTAYIIPIWMQTNTLLWRHGAITTITAMIISCVRVSQTWPCSRTTIYIFGSVNSFYYVCVCVWCHCRHRRCRRSNDTHHHNKITQVICENKKKKRIKFSPKKKNYLENNKTEFPSNIILTKTEMCHQAFRAYFT